jgi:hypothetical protein
MEFSIIIHNRVYNDLDNVVDYHENKKAKTIIIAFQKAVDALLKTPYFAIRYDNIRCLPLGKKLPYMVHFTIDEKTNTIDILALANTKQDPEITWVK